MKSFLKKITGFFAVALMLAALAGGVANVSAQGIGEALSGGSYTDLDYQFSIDFPQGWSIDRTENFGAPIIAFRNPEDEDNALAVMPGGQFHFGLLGGLEPTETEILVGGVEALKKEWQLDNGETLIVITLKNYPSSWRYDNNIQIRVNQEQQMEVMDQMLESFEFLSLEE